MKRTQIFLEDEQDARLAKRAAAARVTKSILVRQAIDAFLKLPRKGITHKLPKKDPARRAELRAVLDELARTPLSLPDGRSYVEQLRTLDRGREEDLERRRA